MKCTRNKEKYPRIPLEVRLRSGDARGVELGNFIKFGVCQRIPEIAARETRSREYDMFADSLESPPCEARLLIT